jgi:hypothetical protein
MEWIEIIIGCDTSELDSLSAKDLVHWPILVHAFLRLPSCTTVSTNVNISMRPKLTLKPTAYWEECCVNSSPSDQNAKVQANPRVQPKQNLSTALYNGMQRPSVSPSVERRCDFDIVERRGNVGDDPEDEEKTHPRLAHDHGHIFAS